MQQGWQPQAPESTPTPVHEVPQTHQVGGEGQSSLTMKPDIKFESLIKLI